MGDGTTSVIVLAGEILASALPFIERDIHPSQIVQAYFKALDEIMKITESQGVDIDVESEEDIAKIVRSCTGTKFVNRYGDLIVNLAIKAVKTVVR